ncbi:MAG: hypothetical protein U0R69_16375 [Gaiellales bacterium]
MDSDTANVLPELRRRLSDRLAQLTAGLAGREEALRAFSARLDLLRSRHTGHGS